MLCENEIKRNFAMQNDKTTIASSRQNMPPNYPLSPSTKQMRTQCGKAEGSANTTLHHQLKD